MPLRRYRRQYEQLLQFDKGRIIGMMEAAWSAGQVARQLGRSYCVVKRCWDQWMRKMSFTQRPGSGRLDRSAVEKTDTSGERLNPAFELQRHTTPTADGMVWGVIAYNTRSPLVLFHGTMIASGMSMISSNTCVATHAMAPRSHLSTRQCSASHGRVSQDCFHTVTTLLWPAGSPDLSPIENIWYHLGWRAWHLTSLSKPEARLQQIWNEMSQDIIQYLYASMPDRISSCIRCRGVQQGIKSSVHLPFSIK
ncbi:transposable element Tcb1 transposase [Trichonephila clavipes]|nr:transposable element Tcb1 transposase [Trichonephila clavipes]